MATVAARIPMVATPDSSSLAAIGFDDDTGTVAIQFRGGTIFHYANVPPDVVGQLYTAPSMGTFYAQQIKGKYPAQRMTGRCPKCHVAGGWIGALCAECGTAAVVPVTRAHGEPTEVRDDDGTREPVSQ